MDNVKQMAALTALNDMMTKGHVNICTVDSVAKMIGVNPKCLEYDILHALHCINFDRMPGELLDKVPDLIRKCLSNGAVFQFSGKIIAGQPTFAIKEITAS